MAEEERDVPDLPTILNDIHLLIAKVDTAQPGQPHADPMNVIRNEILPLLKDLTESVGYALEDVQDLVDPIRLTGAEASGIADILLAAREANPNNPALLEKIQEGLDALDYEEGEGGGDEDDEEDN